VRQTKEKIEEEHKMAADSMKLIAYGKVLEDDNKSLKDYSIKEGDFLVVMVAKVSELYLYNDFSCSPSLQPSQRRMLRWMSLLLLNSNQLSLLLLRIHRPLNPSLLLNSQHPLNQLKLSPQLQS
jgi:Ubiquitin family